MKYDKLVRDKIPEILTQKGLKPLIHISDNQEFEQKLKEKLKEEVDEFLKEDNKEELADILEVIYAICEFKNIEREDLENIRKQKVYERGSFKDKMILEEVEEK
jgi:predicted house-cleaning noncanonical NTP pyrophosphatase (MazG superfamily)